MVHNTKDMILEYLVKLSEHFDYQQINYFTAQSMAQEMHISRSLASQYLNELVKEAIIFKINSRPVYFLHKKAIEKMFKVTLKETEFFDLDDFKDYIQRNGKVESGMAKVVGYDKSLGPVMKQFKEIFEYPPNGLPVILYGEVGTGKRTMSDLIFKNAISFCSIPEKSQMIKVECTGKNEEELKRYLFGDEKQKGIIQSVEAPVVVIGNAQYLSISLQSILSEYLENSHDSSLYHKKKEKAFRLVLLMNMPPSQCLSERLLRSIPVMIHVPSLAEKSSEEKEELTMYLIKNEAAKMERVIKVSNTVLRALVHADYPFNVLGLKNAIQQMCASAMQKSEGAKELVLHSYDLPENILQSLPILLDEEVVYIDVSHYVKSEETDILLDYYDQIVECFQADCTFEEGLKELEHVLDRLFDYLLYKQKSEMGQIKGMEVSLNNILNIVLKRRFINIPSNFSFVIAKLMFFHEQYSSSMEHWHQAHMGKMDKLMSHLKQNLLGESMICEDITRLVESNLEMEISEMIMVIMIITLHRYNAQLSNRKMFGLIIAHGYSTASSISDAVNTLIGNYVFESIDMPLDITIDQIKEILLERLHRMNNNADVVIMVDMGSLEQIGEGLSGITNRSIGVINNVSTRMALNVGYQILQGAQLEEMLQHAAETNKVEYTIVERKQNDRIIFTSESGITTAKRMRELFEKSFPMAIPVDCEICDYHQLLSKGKSHQMIQTGNVLFISGTANPHVEGMLFIPLEGIISSNNIEMIRQGLSKYMEPAQMEIMVNNLRKSFTLQNVVQYLTILNPKVLLDNVSMAIELLQNKMQRRFGGKTLIGIYIHVCCLIERLVTKTSIDDVRNLEDFEKEHADFIRYVKDSFVYITQHYNIEIPTNEVAYLYEFIAADEDRFEHDDFLMKWDRDSK